MTFERERERVKENNCKHKSRYIIKQNLQNQNTPTQLSKLIPEKKINLILSNFYRIDNTINEPQQQ